MTTAFSIHRAVRHAAFLALLPMLTWTPHATAADLPNALFQEAVNLQNTNTGQTLQAIGANNFLPESVSLSVIPAPGGLLSGYASISAGPRPSFQISASSNGIGGYSQASAHIQYVVQLEGALGTSAPITAFTSGWASASGGPSDVTGGYGQLTISANPVSFYVTRQAEVYSPNNQLADSFDEAIPISMMVGVPYHVDMFGTAQSNVGTTTVYLDPAFQFAAGFDSTGYRLTYSPGLVAAVPEPGGAALLLVGMAGLAAARRRRASA